MSLVAVGFILFLFFFGPLIVRTSPTLTPELLLDDAVTFCHTLYSCCLWRVAFDAGGSEALALKQVKKPHMLMGTAVWLVAVIAFLVSRTQLIPLFRVSGNSQTATSEAMKAAHLVSAEYAIELSNVFSNIAWMLIGIASIVIGSVMNSRW